MGSDKQSREIHLRAMCREQNIQEEQIDEALQQASRTEQMKKSCQARTDPVMGLLWQGLQRAMEEEVRDNVIRVSHPRVDCLL